MKKHRLEILGLIATILCIGSLLILFPFCTETDGAKTDGAKTVGAKTKNRSTKYLGVWEGPSMTRIEIEAKPNKKIEQKITLRDGKEAKLLLPVRVRNRKGQDLGLMIGEGIYDVEGDTALIATCNYCQAYVVFGLRENKEGGIEVGIPNYTGERHIQGHMRHMHPGAKSYFGDFNWVSYKRVPGKKPAKASP